MYLVGISRPFLQSAIGGGQVLRCAAYHGKLSSASTGRFAALRLPLEFRLSELNIMSSFFEVGPSRSMSSSKSDMAGGV